MTDNTERFSDRVEDYVRYRPTYPVEVVRELESRRWLVPGATVAELGAGTGIWTAVLAAEGWDVLAVEPNDEMRGACALAFEDEARVRVLPGSAEETGLDDAVADLVTAAQALHWFDPEQTPREIVRISKPPHRLAALWNSRDKTSEGFHAEYEALLQRYGIGYTDLMKGRASLEESLEQFFGHTEYDLFTAPNEQRLDWPGFVGRLMSCSYGPRPDHPHHDPVVAGLREIFQTHNEDGFVVVRYETRMYCGEVSVR